MVFARARGRAVACLPRSPVGRLAFPTRPPCDSSSPTATSWTRWRGASRTVEISGTPPHPLRHLRHPGRSAPGAASSPLGPTFRRNVPDLAALPSSLGSSVLLGWAPLPGVSGSVGFPSRARRDFGREVPPSLLLPPSWLVPPRRFAPLPASDVLQSVPGLGFVRLAPGRPLALRSPSLEGRRSAAGRVRMDPHALPSKVRISSGGRRASLPRLSPPAVPPSLLARSLEREGRLRRHRSPGPVRPACPRSPGGSRFDPHRLSAPKCSETVGGACSPGRVPRGVSSTRGAHSGTSPRARARFGSRRPAACLALRLPEARGSAGSG